MTTTMYRKDKKVHVHVAGPTVKGHVRMAAIFEKQVYY